MKTFTRSFMQVGLVAVNTVLITKGAILAFFIVSMLISLLWSLNVSKISVSTHKEKFLYSFGAGCGAVCGYYFSHLFA